MLDVCEIQKGYEGRQLLNGVSFKVDSGEIVCLLGESGSGKSTLLRIIAGLEGAEAGTVRWNQQDIDTLPAHKRGFGLMFQDYALFPHKTVAQNVAFGLRMQNLPKDEVERRTREALQTIRMESFGDRPVTELSGGEQQRVALARALAPDPRLLMLDEPLGALDHSLRVQLIKELRQVLHQSRKPVIYVTHDHEEAFALADRLLILHDGIILQEGIAQELFDRPTNTWTAGFLGLGNLLPGKVLSLDPLVIATSAGKLRANDGCEDLRSGQTCTLLVRPQDGVINPQDLSLPNQIGAVVLDCVFMGEYYRLDLLAGEVNLQVHSRQPYPVGEVLSIAFPPGKTHCLAD